MNPFFRRRVNIEKVREFLKINAEQVYYETESYRQFKYELTLRVVEAIMWNEYELGWENLPEEEEIEFVTEVSNILEKDIKTLFNKYKKKISIQESIRRILREETQGIDSFIDTIDSKYNMNDELRQFLIDFIKNSDCKKIEFADFKIGAMGLAVHDGVLINNSGLNRGLEFLLFLIFHEVAHQYQFKKYGEDIMYNCYLGDISEEEGAKFMKHTEEVADDFASRKIRELQNKGLIGKSYIPPQMYKNAPINSVKMMVNNYREMMRRNNITSPEKISEFFYNMVKKNL